MRGFQPAGGKPQAKKSAGPVRGPGTGTSDDVADTVQEGTYIMPTDSTEAIGEQNLAAMGKGAPVDVQLSNGEFKLPPEQVHAIGVQALDQMKDATHTPVAARGFAPGAQQEAEPPLFFANGGVVDEENAKRFAQVPASFGNRGNNTFGAAPPAEPVAQPAQAPVAQAAPAAAASPNQASPTNIFPQSSPAAGANIYSGAGFTADQFGSSGKFAQVPNSIGQQPGRQQPAAPAALAPQGMTDAQRATAISQIPTGGVTAPKPPAPAAPLDLRASPRGLPAAQAPDGGGFGEAVADVGRSVGSTLAGAFPGTTMAARGAMDDTRQAYQQSGIGGALGAAARTAMTPVIGLADDVIGSADRALDPAKQALKTFVTGDATPIGQQAAAPAAAKPAASQAVAANPNAAAPASGATQIKPGITNNIGAAPEASLPVNTTAAAAATEPNQPSATQIAPGVFRSGNSYSDSAAGAQSMQTRGLPSAQNMAAADALAQRSQQESMSRVMAGQPVERGWSGVIGTDPAAGNAARERRDLVSSLMTPLRGAQNGQLTAHQRNGMLSLLDQEARGAQAKANNATTLQQTEMQTNTQRDMTAMREAGDNSRAVLREAGETGRADARNAIDQGRLDLDQQVRGFDIRAGQRQEKLYEKYDAAKTPEEKSAIVQQIRDMSGKAEPTNRYTVVPGGQEWDANAGAMRNVPGRVFNNQIGQFVEQQGAQAQPQPAPQDAAKRVVGQTYVGPNGKVAKWNGKDWTPV